MKKKISKKKQKDKIAIFTGLTLRADWYSGAVEILHPSDAVDFVCLHPDLHPDESFTVSKAAYFEKSPQGKAKAP